MEPHDDQPILSGGTDLDSATAGGVLVHGRGATARSILQMGEQVHAEGMAYLAPQAARNTWYPNSFLSSIDSNEPGLSSGLAKVETAVDRLRDAGISRERILLCGFSQGACLASEFLARNADRYGGLVAFSGGVIGPDGTPRDYDGSLDGTPVFIGCSDADPHIPLERVEETARVFEDLDGDVDKRIYEGMGHTVNDDELDYLRELVTSLVSE
ncbi:alpha/beta hydrolase [Halovenus marina]|uniref:alpha/beta hydrolase n=1 Tax=Halovenus marina TaxID=3396621 RepID=UPI003F5702C7